MLEKKLHLAQTRHISSMTGSGPIGSCRRVLVIVTDVDLREYIKGCLDGCRELDAGVLSARTRASLQKARLPDLIIADFGLLHAEAHACHPSLSECLKDCSVPLLLLTGLTGNGVRPGNRETPGISRLRSMRGDYTLQFTPFSPARREKQTRAQTLLRFRCPMHSHSVSTRLLTGRRIVFKNISEIVVHTIRLIIRRWITASSTVP